MRGWTFVEVRPVICEGWNFIEVRPVICEGWNLIDVRPVICEGWNFIDVRPVICEGWNFIEVLPVICEGWNFIEVRPVICEDWNFIEVRPVICEGWHFIEVRPFICEGWNFIEVCPVICEGWNCIHTWKSRARPHHFMKWGELGLCNSLSPAVFLLLVNCLCQARKLNGLICVLGVLILPLSTIFVFDFGTIPTVWYFSFFILYISSLLKVYSCNESCHSVCLNSSRYPQYIINNVDTGNTKYIMNNKIV